MSAGQAVEPQSWRSVVPLSGVAGLLMVTLFIASPLTVCVVVYCVLFFKVVGRGWPADERRAVYAVLGAALLVRVAMIVATFVTALPHLNDLSIGALTGDESYNLARAIRMRDILLGFGSTRYDYFVTTDQYGRTLYGTLLGWVQLAFGPTPFSMRLANAMMFLTGSTVLYRQARVAFGSTPAIAGLAVLLFIPSLLVSSISLLKESFYFLTTCVAIAAFVTATRSWRLRDLLVGAIVIAVCVLILNDLRRGAAVLTLAGLGLGLGLRAVVGVRWRVVTAALLMVAAVTVVVVQPELKRRANDAVLFVAKTHAGHVFTVGHAYKLMDEGFYVYPGIGSNWEINLTDAQALRFLIRAAVSFVVTPLPWTMASMSELAFLPEHMLWYVLLALVPVGLVAGWARDPVLTSTLIGYAIPSAVAIALTNGNVGTLLRMRGLISPYVIWLSVLALLTIAEHLIRRARQSSTIDARLAMQGPSL